MLNQEDELNVEVLIGQWEHRRQSALEQSNPCLLRDHFSQLPLSVSQRDLYEQTYNNFIHQAAANSNLSFKLNQRYLLVDEKPISDCYVISS